MQLQVRTNNITCVARQSVFAVVGEQYLNAQGKNGFSGTAAKDHESRGKAFASIDVCPLSPI